MREFFYPSSIAIFGAGTNPDNLAKNILLHCQQMGFQGEIYPVGREPGEIHGRQIATSPDSLPDGIELAVILVPASLVAETLEACGRKGIRHAIISTGGFRELDGSGSQAEGDILTVSRKYGIRFIGPNCIGVICIDSGLCTPFNPIQTGQLSKGPVSLIVQSGGVTTQSAYSFSEQHVGFSKIISVGNKLNVNERDLVEYLQQDEDTDQIHLYLESVEDGRELMRLAKGSRKPIVVYKANVSRTASQIALSHTAALFNDDRVVSGAFRQSGVVRVESVHEMTVCAKALQLPPLRGDRLVVISLSGGFSVVLADTCERLGFECPELPRQLLDRIESFRRGGVIRMGNPMDFGDVHDMRALAFAVENCLTLDYIDGLVLCFMYDRDMTRFFGREVGGPDQILGFVRGISERAQKPIALSFFAPKQDIEMFQKTRIFPVFNDSVESVLALRMLRDCWRAEGARIPARQDSPQSHG